MNRNRTDRSGVEWEGHRFNLKETVTAGKRQTPRYRLIHARDAAGLAPYVDATGIAVAYYDWNTNKVVAGCGHSVRSKSYSCGGKHICSYCMRVKIRGSIRLRLVA
jgi:hypothetical protein